jgi:DNA-binding Lrp family transcriptional regulator
MVSMDNMEVIAMKRLKSLSKLCGGRDTVPFIELHASLSPAMSISKPEVWAILKSMEDNGLIEVDPFDGIRLI